jgi:pimeloyl-ACP methyl ester carboxylesterase
VTVQDSGRVRTRRPVGAATPEVGARTRDAVARTPERRRLRAADGVVIDAVHLPRRAPAVPGRGQEPPAGDLAVVLAHGFTGSWRHPRVARVARRLASGAGVVGLDLRGHGASGGVSTVGDREVLDVEAAVAWARRLGYARVATVGFSMGGSVVVRHAALHGGVAAVVSVSAPSRWYYRGTPAMRRMHWVVETAPGRVVARRLLGTRIAGPGWDPRPEPPTSCAPRIAPTPMLVVHGDRDAFFPLEHAYALAEAAGPTSTLWVERGFGHAEGDCAPALAGRILGWVVDTLEVQA